MDFQRAEEPGRLRRILPIEKVDEESAEMKELDIRQLEEDEPMYLVTTAHLDKIDENEELVASSTSGGVGIRSPRTEIVHHWQVMASSVGLHLSSDDEEFDSTQRLTAHMEGMNVNQERSETSDRMDAGGDGSDVDEQDNWDDGPCGASSNSHLTSWLTTVGPLKNKDSDPTDLQRVVDYGQMQQVEEVSVMEGSAPEQLHRTLGEMDQKRQTLGEMVRSASRRLTSTASLPRDMKGWTAIPKTSATSVIQKGRTLLRTTGNRLFGHGKTKKTYFTCEEAAGDAQADTLSVHMCGDSATTTGCGEEIENTAELEKISEENCENKKGSKLHILKKQLLRKLSQRSKGADQ